MWIKLSLSNKRPTDYISVGQWVLNFSGQADPALNTGKFGTSDLSAQALFELSIQGRGAAVKRTTRNSDGSTTTVLLEKETEAECVNDFETPSWFI